MDKISSASDALLYQSDILSEEWTDAVDLDTPEHHSSDEADINPIRRAESHPDDDLEVDDWTPPEDPNHEDTTYHAEHLNVGDDNKLSRSYPKYVEEIESDNTMESESEDEGYQSAIIRGGHRVMDGKTPSCPRADRNLPLYFPTRIPKLTRMLA